MCRLNYERTECQCKTGDLTGLGVGTEKKYSLGSPSLACFALALLAFSFACVEKQGDSEQSRIISLKKNRLKLIHSVH